jgi:hypothetical protein
MTTLVNPVIQLYRCLNLKVEIMELTNYYEKRHREGTPWPP